MKPGDRVIISEDWSKKIGRCSGKIIRRKESFPNQYWVEVDKEYMPHARSSRGRTWFVHSSYLLPTDENTDFFNLI